MKPLTDKQQAFVNEYMIDFNGTQAAIRAGFNPKSARTTASDMLAKPNIAAAVARARAKQDRRTGITADRVLQELARLAFVDARRLIDNDTGEIKPGASDDDSAAISSVKVKIIPTEDGNIIEREVKMHDKIKALDLLSKHLGITDAQRNATSSTGDSASGVIQIPVVADMSAPPTEPAEANKTREN